MKVIFTGRHVDVSDALRTFAQERIEKMSTYLDDVIDVLQEEATEDFDRMAGIAPSDKPYSRTGVLEMWKRRIPWLMFLMLSATFTPKPRR